MTDNRAQEWELKVFNRSAIRDSTPKFTTPANISEYSDARALSWARKESVGVGFLVTMGGKVFNRLQYVS
jgi:hypothetical protein